MPALAPASRILIGSGCKLNNISTTALFSLPPPAHSPVDCVGLGLGRILDVGLVEQVLDAEQDLFDCDRGAPVLLLVQQRQADGAGGIHVGMEQWRLELAFGRACGVVVFEDHPQFIQAALPRCLKGGKRELDHRSGRGRPPSNNYVRTPFLPGIAHSHVIRFSVPSGFLKGRATKPWKK